MAATSGEDSPAQGEDGMRSYRRIFFASVGVIAFAFGIVEYARYGLAGSDERGYPGVTYLVAGLAVGVVCFGQAFRGKR